MSIQLTGKELHRFFQNHDFWGSGQSFRDLSILVDGRCIGAEQFRLGWDPSDIDHASSVVIVSGVWEGIGLFPGICCIMEIISTWLSGGKPKPFPKSHSLVASSN